ncbi:heme/hemin ABC transporter substrate-binding protein [Phytohabitans suffuscus]|uniref:ABC transporter substrate-binding protein n=1 Tax=Phytohabitans suffuscus TaxID=624315 RepID=A0A6F8YAL6_9ACTN|nr:ABC transporter substrate-binding protein [Phytohabitans suffuscus]BCB83174.1 ABC transporter substrate-binding protein [Phytohabitans suffuscus]
MDDSATSRGRSFLAVRAGGVLVSLVLAASCTATGSPTASDPSAGGRPQCVGPATASSQPSVEVIATGPTPRLPVTYTDITGKPVTITDASRILALDTYGTLATTVYALGLGDRLVGRDVSTGIPELRHLPLVTHNGHDLNGEAILNLRPSVILTDYSIGPLEVQLQLRDSGIPVVIMSDKRSRDQVGPQIEEVAKALGVPELGERLAERVRGEIEAARARVTALAPKEPAHRLRMVFLYMRGNAGVYYWFGKGSGADDLIQDLGGIDVATEAGLSGMRPLNAEGLATANPDLYLMMTRGLESVGGIDGLKKVPGVADTSAGQRSCVVDMSDYQVLSFGPQFPATLEALAEAVYRRAVRP